MHKLVNIKHTGKAFTMALWWHSQVSLTEHNGKAFADTRGVIIYSLDELTCRTTADDTSAKLRSG
jgi:hypothetical protein